MKNTEGVSPPIGFILLIVVTMSIALVLGLNAIIDNDKNYKQNTHCNSDTTHVEIKQ